MKDKTYNIAGNYKNEGYQRALASMVHKCFDKKTGWRAGRNEQLAEE